MSSWTKHGAVTSFSTSVAEINQRSASEVVKFAAEAEAVRIGDKFDDHDALQRAAGRVLRANPALADLYFADPNASCPSEIARKVQS